MTDQIPAQQPTTATHQIHLPRITIQYCTQCKWMLRAAYFAQELLSTFSTDLGEVALVPARGGIFTVTVFHPDSPSKSESGKKNPNDETAAAMPGTVNQTVIWDRKRDGGFPEVKALKSLVRNIIDPERDLGHTDRALHAGQQQQQQQGGEKKESAGDTPGTGEKKACEDCR